MTILIFIAIALLLYNIREEIDLKISRDNLRKEIARLDYEKGED
jgi:hypothetical protein